MIFSILLFVFSFGFKLQFLGALNPASIKRAFSDAMSSNHAEQSVDSDSFLGNCEN
jgi:hypothetical protein